MLSLKTHYVKEKLDLCSKSLWFMSRSYGKAKRTFKQLLLFTNVRKRLEKPDFPIDESILMEA